MTAILPIKQLHHVALVTTQTARSVAFYRDVLGFAELRRPDFDFRGAWLYGYGVQLHVIEHEALSQPAREHIQTRENHLAFSVSDVEAAQEVLRAHDVSYHEQVNAGGARQIFFQDPDGHHIELAVYQDPSLGYEGA